MVAGKTEIIGLWLKNKFVGKVTIYNDIPASGEEDRRFERHVIGKCLIQGGFIQQTNGTIQNILTAKTVITQDTEHYRSPAEYSELTLDEREKYYTVKIGDYIVLREVPDEVHSGRELETLQRKYGDDCISVTNVTVNIYGLDVDNVTITNI